MQRGTSNAPHTGRRLLVAAAAIVATLISAGSSDAVAACAPTSGQQNGVDISDFQGTVNFSQVAGAGNTFVYARATYGLTTTDPDYAANETGTKAAGLKFGAYAVLVPTQDPVAQANHFLAVAGVSGGDLLPMLDVVDGGEPAGQSPAQLNGEIASWLDTVQHALGVRPIVYTAKGLWHANNADDTSFAASGDPLWTADVSSPSIPALAVGWSTWMFWQYSFNGTVPGITGVVDKDRFNAAFDGGNLCAATVDAVAAAAPPFNTGAPQITGTPATGQQLQCSQGRWAGSPSSFAYAWRRDGTAIAAATQPAYTVTTQDRSHGLVCRVTATNGTGSTGADSNGVTVSAAPLPPALLGAPAISGTPSKGSQLSCSTGAWENAPTAYTYQWSRDLTPIQQATTARYTVATLDEGSALTCSVVAMNTGGSSAPAGSRGVTVPVPHVPGCPAATGSVSGTRLGLLRLGMTRAQARRAYKRSATRGFKYKDFFCLTPKGVRVGYASPALLRALPRSRRSRVAGAVVWASTSNPVYAVGRIRTGATLGAAQQALPHGVLLHIGLNYWYLAPAGAGTAVLKVRAGIVEEIGIAEKALTETRSADLTLMKSFD